MKFTSVGTIISFFHVSSAPGSSKIMKQIVSITRSAIKTNVSSAQFATRVFRALKLIWQKFTKRLTIRKIAWSVNGAVRVSKIHSRGQSTKTSYAHRLLDHTPANFAPNLSKARLDFSFTRRNSVPVIQKKTCKIQKIKHKSPYLISAFQNYNKSRMRSEH